MCNVFCAHHDIFSPLDAQSLDADIVFLCATYDLRALLTRRKSENREVGGSRVTTFLARVSCAHLTCLSRQLMYLRDVASSDEE